MYTMTQSIIDGLKLRVPFYDRYVLAKDKKENKNECVIDRVYTNQIFHVFSLILRDSTPENFASNLLTPDKWIDPTRQAVKNRKKAGKKNDIHLMDVKEHRTEAAVSLTHAGTIRKALKEAHTILFETEFDELPLVSYIQGWQFLIQARYEIENGELNTKTRTLKDEPQNVIIQEKK